MLRISNVLLSASIGLVGLASASTAQDTLPNSVAAGEVTTNSAVLWTHSTAPGLIRFRISKNPQFPPSSLQRFTFSLGGDRPVKVLVSPLQSGRTYYYEARDSAGSIETGVFRSAPHANSRDGLHFGVSGDARGDVMPFGSVSNVPGKHLDFFALLGDTIYADVESPGLPGVAQATTLAEFRAKHSEVYSQFAGVNGLADLRRSTAVLSVIDDHEVTNDFAGGAHPSTDPRFDQTGNFINETQLYRNGLQAFVEYNPLLPTFYGPTGDPRTTFKRKLYRAQRYGKDAAVFLLDARSFRDTELPAVNPFDPQSVLNFLVATFDPARTMLGHKQLEDVKRDLVCAEQAGVVWKFVLVPEPIQNLGVLAAGDRFEGYAAERSEILGHIVAHGIRNVVFVAADIHGTLINDLTYQLGPGQAQLPTDSFEISVGAIAYDAPFGPTVVGLAFQLGLLSQQQLDFYNSLPTVGKDAFVRGIVDQQITPLGYNPIGLENSTIPATLLQGSYIATHVYGWSEFDIAPQTGVLTITTYGVDPAQPLAAPAVFSRFSVQPR